jgi:hypothetical protein
MNAANSLPLTTAERKSPLGAGLTSKQPQSGQYSGFADGVRLRDDTAVPTSAFVRAVEEPCAWIDGCFSLLLLLVAPI